MRLPKLENVALAAVVAVACYFIAATPTGRLQLAYCDASDQAGAPDLAAQINACYTSALGVTASSAGVIDARNFPIRSQQVFNSDPFAPGNRSGILLLGCYDLYISFHPNQPQHKFAVKGCGQSSPGSSSYIGKIKINSRPRMSRVL